MCFLFFMASHVHAQTRTITGTVIGKDDGLPLPGVSVTALGTKTGTQTGVDGSFSIKIESGGSLVFKSIGFTTQTIKPTGNKVDVVMIGLSNDLNEVQVIGYGTQSRRESVGNIATVKGSDVIEEPVQNFEQALAGRASGVQITIPNGVMNTPPVFHIRGINSISLSAQPLIIVDGIASFDGNVGGGESGSNALANINPNDIESIDVAKDGAATAIYGSRAANGVVFITTKKGKKGDAVVSLDTWVGISQPFRLPKVLDANQYIAIKNESIKNAGLYNAATLSANPINDANGNMVNTDWEKLLYRTGKSYNTTASISGGTDRTTYYASAVYGNQQGIIQTNAFNNRGMLFNIDHKLNKYITLGLKISYYDQLNLANISSGSLPGEAFDGSGVGRLAVLLPPNVSPYNLDGSYSTTTSGIGIGNNYGFSIVYPNPIPQIDHDRRNNELYHTAANLYIAVKPLPWITLKTSYGVDNINSTNDSFSNPFSNYTVSGGVTTNAASASTSNTSNKRYSWDNTAQFDYTFFQKNNFSLLLGNEQQGTTTVGSGLTRSILSDQTFDVIQAGYVNIGTTGLVNTKNYLVSFFGRLNYNFDQKYFLSATLRRDGYSAFGTDSKFGYFPGLGVSWSITKENFWKSIGADKVFSSFKIRASYARVGNNAGLADYASTSTSNSSLYNTHPTLLPYTNGNNSLAWETSKKNDIGFDYGILNDRITGEVAYYKNDISGLIFNVPVSPSYGLASNPPDNIGAMYNKGFEFSINADIIRSGSFRWTANFNISFNTNKITALIPGTNSFTYSTSGSETASINTVGKPVGDLWIIKTAGVDPNNGRRIFVNGQGKNVEYTFLGTTHWYNMDGTPYLNAAGQPGTINQTADSRDYGNTSPKELGGLTNTFHYKNFDLNVLLTYQLGFYDYYGTQATMTDQRFFNNSTIILDHWTTPGQVARFPQVVFGDNVSNGTTLPLDINTYRGDFLKVKTVNFGYTIPKSFLTKLGMSSLRVYVTGQNLFIITKYPGPDPEVASNGSSTNGNSSGGIDRNTAANSRTFTAGFSVKF